MPHFEWEGIDISGKTHKGSLTARTQQALEETLLESGIALIRVAEKNSDAAAPFTYASSTTQNDIIILFEYMYYLIDSGIPLLNALQTATQQIQNTSLRKALDSIAQDIEHGSTLAHALSQQKNLFSPAIIEIIHAGEQSGALAQTLNLICSYLQHKNTFKQKLTQAAILPLFTILFALFISLVIIMFIIPQFHVFFTSMDKEIPPLTQKLIALSTFMQSPYALSIPLIFLAIWGISKTHWGKYIIYSISARLPLLHPITTSVHLIQTLKILTLFLRAGIPLNQALIHNAQTTHNPLYKNKLMQLSNEITKGQQLSTHITLIAPTSLGTLLQTFSRLGEQTGTLAIMLEKATTLIEAQLHKKIATTTALFQPILMIIVGIIVMILMIAIYMPLFTMAHAI